MSNLVSLCLAHHNAIEADIRRAEKTALRIAVEGL
jgi:hypothetical protein